MRFIDGVGYVDIPDEKNDWYDVPSDEMTLEQARQAVKDLRKKLAEYLEQEPILDKIRTEIEEYRNSLPWESDSISLVKWDAINYILEQIIDKYLESQAERSDKE